MLKECIINNEKITVPVPILNMGDMIDWANSLESSYGGVVTKLVVDGKSIYEGVDRSKTLEPTSKVVLNIDTPMNLSQEVISAVISMLEISSIVIKDQAVNTWKTGNVSLSTRRIIEDIRMIKELLDSISSLSLQENSCEFDFGKHTGTLHSLHQDLLKKLKSNDAKGFSSLLLNKVDPFFKELKEELSELYMKLISSNN